MPAALHVLSSMATRRALAELIDAWHAAGGMPVRLESVGGAEAARRVAGGEAVDLVVLADDAIARLANAGHVVADSRVALVQSPAALAVRAGAPRPDIATEDALRAAVLQARGLGHSTGPSGDHLHRLFARWGVLDTLRARLVQAPPGVPVARLLADGTVTLGVQQLSELVAEPDVDVVGPLPGAAQFITTFTAARGCGYDRAAQVNALTAFLTAPEAAAIHRRHGLAPAAATPSLAQVAP